MNTIGTKGISYIRRVVAVLLVGIVATAILGVSIPHETRADGAVRFMKTVKKELLRAARSKSQTAFDKALRRHADIPRIAINSLGSYSKRLPKSRRPAFYKGVKKFMANYFTQQSRSYKIVSADIHSPSVQDGKYRAVDSTVYLDSGFSYSVRWLVGKRTGRYKIVDVQVLGMWLTPFQRDLFIDYVKKAGGNVNALIWALNQ